MNPTPPASSFSIVDALGTGLPHLLLQFLVTVALLVIGVAIYMAVTSFRERELVAQGNVAAGVVLGGAVLGLAIPLAALLATTSSCSTSSCGAWWRWSSSSSRSASSR